MKKLKLIPLLLLTTLISVNSCKKYLNIQPEDKFLDEAVFRNETNIQQVLNGIYRQLSAEELYGGNLTMTALDVLGQYYNTSTYGTNKNWDLYANYNYTVSPTLSTFDVIWSKMYRAILDINLFIEKLENSPDQVMSKKRKDILLGEAYTLRAFLHFDLLRLYGPIYKTGSDLTAIPYMNRPTNQPAPLRTASEVMEAINTDIQHGLTFLENDPIRKEGIVALSSVDTDENYFKLRNRRMNYFAAKLLLARVLLYQGDKSAARAVALELLGECSVHFPWSPAAQSLPMSSNPDRIFSSELLFAVENLELYKIQKNTFASALESAQILVTTEKILNSIYPNVNDYRLRSAWILDASSTKTYKTFFKFDEVKTSSSTIRFMQPLMRISEIYYILAECENDKNTALAYLNEVRKNRGLEPLNNDVVLEKELSDEYRREFWGEGQMFFYYKRKNSATIPNGNSATAQIAMSNTSYVVPLPLSETNNR